MKNCSRIMKHCSNTKRRRKGTESNLNLQIRLFANLTTVLTSQKDNKVPDFYGYEIKSVKGKSLLYSNK